MYSYLKPYNTNFAQILWESSSVGQSSLNGIKPGGFELGDPGHLSTYLPPATSYGSRQVKAMNSAKSYRGKAST